MFFINHIGVIYMKPAKIAFYTFPFQQTSWPMYLRGKGKQNPHLSS